MTHTITALTISLAFAALIAWLSPITIQCWTLAIDGFKGVIEALQ